MHKSIIKITTACLIVISNTISFGMVTIANKHKNYGAKNCKCNSQGFKTGLKRSQEELKAEKQKLLLIEAAPLGSSLEDSLLSADILITIGARADDEIKDQLRATCRFMAKKLSLKQPYRSTLVANPLFHTNAKNISFIALNAAWDGDYKTLENLLEKLPPSLLEIFYVYPVATNMSLHFHISDVIAAKKLIHCSGAVLKSTDNSDSIWDKIEGLLKKHNIELCQYPRRCNELMMACYNGDTNRVNKYFLNNTHTDSEMFSVDVKKGLWIAINRDKPECIALLAHHIQKFDDEADNFEEFWKVLQVAMIHNKKQSFEALVTHDLYECLNSTLAHQSILDRIINWDATQCNGNWYSDRYKKLGGKTYAELSSAKK